MLIKKIENYNCTEMRNSIREHPALIRIEIPQGQLDPTSFSLATGEDAVLDEVWSFQSVNDVKDRWYAAAPPADMENGMPFVKNTTGVVYGMSLGMMLPEGGSLPITSHVANYVILEADLNAMHSMKNDAARTLTLCSIDGTHIGKFLIIGKLGAGRVTIGSDAGTTISFGDQIAKTSLFNGVASELSSWICLRVTTATVWTVMWASNPALWVLA